MGLVPDKSGIIAENPYYGHATSYDSKGANNVDSKQDILTKFTPHVLYVSDILIGVMGI
jgi:hypothetical protein